MLADPAITSGRLRLVIFCATTSLYKINQEMCVKLVSDLDHAQAKSQRKFARQRSMNACVLSIFLVGNLRLRYPRVWPCINQRV
jgi:hypothetical protein